MYSTRKNVKYFNLNKSIKRNKRSNRKSIKRSNRKSIKRSNRSNKKSKRSNTKSNRSIKRSNRSNKKSNKKNITLKQKGGGNFSEENILTLSNILSNIFTFGTEQDNKTNLDNFIREFFLPKLTTDQFINDYTEKKTFLLQKKDITDIKYFYNLYTDYHIDKKNREPNLKKINEKINPAYHIELLTQAETGKIMILEDRVIKFILNMDESREGAQKKKKKCGITGGGQKGGAYKSIEMKDTFEEIDRLLVIQKDKVLHKFAPPNLIKVVPLSITRILNNDYNIEKLYDIRRDFIFGGFGIRRKGDITSLDVRNKVINQTKEAIIDDSKLRHTINIDINQINPFYDLLCPLIDIHLLYNKKGEINNETLRLPARLILNKTATIDDDLGSKVLPITKEVNDYFGGNIHPYFSTSNIINEDCGFNEVIVNRIIRKYLEETYSEDHDIHLRKKLIEIKDFSLGFIPSEKSGNKLPIEPNTDYGCKYTLIDMEKCGVKIKFGDHIEIVSNLSELMIKSLNYIETNVFIRDPTTPFLTNVIKKLLFGRKNKKNEDFGFEDNIITNINLIIKEIFKKPEDIDISNIINNLKELEYTLPANYNGYSFFGLLLELRENLGFIHGDLKTGNVFIRYTKEAANTTANPTVLTFKINDPEDPENYGILDKIECIVADLDKARLQVPMDTMLKLFKKKPR